jgi:[NiFe] hydrogenase assembly HybE family chaperone
MSEQARSPAEQLVAAFREIHATRMHGLPFVNGALVVEAVGFRLWNDRWLGILITPWFMNLVLLPGEGEARRAKWQSLKLGDSAGYAFPAGVFEFIGGNEASIGEFQSCSLFSPVFEFADQVTARQTAEAALAALFGELDETAGAEVTVARESKAAAPVAVSKRDFLRGRWGAVQASE